MKYIGVMGLPGGSEIILIIFIILLLFGAKKLPDLARSMGKSLGEFKKGQQESESPDEEISKIGLWVLFFTLLAIFIWLI